MQSSKEQQGEIRKLSSVINAKIQRKTIEWERPEISSRKLEILGTFHAKMGSIKDRNCRDLTEPTGIKIAGRNINNLRFADGITLMAESEEELKSS